MRLQAQEAHKAITTGLTSPNLIFNEAHMPLTHDALQLFIDSFESDPSDPQYEVESILSSYGESESSQFGDDSSITSIGNEGRFDTTTMKHVAQDNCDQRTISRLLEQLRRHNLNFPNSSRDSSLLSAVPLSIKRNKKVCKRSCSCSCHSRHISPRFLTHVFGWLRVDSTKIPV